MPLSVKGIDHFVIRVQDLDAGEKLYKRFGFTLTPRGFHVGRGSANHTAPLSSGNYIELVHLPPDADPAPFPPRPEGPVALALVPSDSGTIHAELTALGYEVDPPRNLARPVHLTDGTCDAKFFNANFPHVAPQSVRFFACQHLTRDLVWRPEWEGHANGADRVTGVIIVHPSPADLQAEYGRLYSEANVAADRAGLTVTLGNDTIALLTPAAFKERFPGIPIPIDISQGWFAGATLRVPSLEKVVEILGGEGIPVVRTPSGALAVPPAAAADTLLEFRAA
jgi:catechol 2,3-dioxygenase-like lactoylglutathione lyase family enzyme